MRAVIQADPEQVDRSVEVDAYVRRLQEQVDRALTLASGFSQELRGIVAAIEDPLRLAYLLGSLLDMPADDKQILLEADTLLAKLEQVSQAARTRDRAARSEREDRIAGAAGDV